MAEPHDGPAPEEVRRITDLEELIRTAPALNAEDRTRIRGLMPPVDRT